MKNSVLNFNLREMATGRFPYPGTAGHVPVWLCLAVASLISGQKSSAQPVLEHTYPVSATICNLEESGDKYFAMDVANRYCRIYNMDHSPYRSISLTVPEGYYLYDIQHVSEHMFNQDDLIEFVYIYSKYNPTETSYYYSYEARVINENGEELLKIPGAGYTEMLEAEYGSRKFLVYVYDFYQVPATTQTMVYSLPDEPMKSGPIQQQHRLGNPWPNPSRGTLNIPVKIPPGESPGELILYNIHGQEVLRQPVDEEQEFIILPGGLLIPGTYVVKLKSEQGETSGKKITIR
jgi:hypothetical protein